MTSPKPFLVKEDPDSPKLLAQVNPLVHESLLTLHESLLTLHESLLTLHESLLTLLASG